MPIFHSTINFEIYLGQDTGTELYILHACWFISPEQCCFTPVDNLRQVVRFLVFARVNHQQSSYIGVSGHYNEKNNLCYRHHFSDTFSRDPAVQLYYRGQLLLGKRATPVPRLAR